MIWVSLLQQVYLKNLQKIQKNTHKKSEKQKLPKISMFGTWQKKWKENIITQPNQMNMYAQNELNKYEWIVQIEETTMVMLEK